MQTETAHYQQYYGDLEIYVFAPRYYYNSKLQKRDSYSKQIVKGKHQDLSSYFFEYVAGIFTDLPFKPDLIVVAPSHEKGSFSPTLDALARKLSKEYGLPYANVVERVREGKKLTTCGHLDERYIQVNGAFCVDYNMEGLKVVLLDDTKTTGLTTLECAKELKAAGATDVVTVCLGINY
jgi:predicted amidophosphoribosyltransferase